MKLRPFELHQPESLAEASRLLSELGDAAAAVHGGTELLLAMKLGLADYAHLVGLKRVPELRGMEIAGDVLRIGAATTHREVEKSAEVRRAIPAMAEMASNVANIRVRCVGTIGGNLCFADPHSDPATFLAATGATVICSDGATTRRIPIESFLRGPYQTALETGELLTAVEAPVPPRGTGIAHVRMKTHERPTVTVAATVRVEAGSVVSAKLAVGSVCSVPAVPDTVSALTGAPLAGWEEAVRACAEETAAAVEPVADANGATGYKRALVEVLVRRALSRALATAGGDGGRSGTTAMAGG